MEIKAIGTVYNGYKFRSRLEARWAVFFDAAGIKYEYEPEGFTDGDLCYLPDFYLPWFKCYVEIKPKNSTELLDAQNKLWKLFKGKDDCCCMVCVGSPADDNMIVYCKASDGNGAMDSEFQAKFLQGCWFKDINGWYCGGKRYISLVCETKRNTTFFDRNYNILPLQQSHTITEIRSDLKWAKNKAIQARFEHGEKG